MKLNTIEPTNEVIERIYNCTQDSSIYVADNVRKYVESVLLDNNMEECRYKLNGIFL